MPKTDPSDLFANVPIFQGLTKKDLKAIARSAKEVTHRRGSVLAREGDTGVGFFLIVDGKATVDIGGTPRAQMGPGDFFGEISLIDNGPRTATVTADTQITTLGSHPGPSSASSSRTPPSPRRC